jgi:hypothetical protein
MVIMIHKWSGMYSYLPDNRLDILPRRDFEDFELSTMLLTLANEASGFSLFCSEVSCKLIENAAAATAAPCTISM